MELNINKKDTKTLIAASAGFLAFFLPWIGGGFFGQHSGYDLMTYGNKLGINKAWLLILLPASFAAIVLFRLNIIKDVPPKIIKVIELVPIALIGFGLLKICNALGIGDETFNNISSKNVEVIFEIFKIGFPLTIISAIMVALAPARKTTQSEEDVSPETDYRKVGEEFDQKLLTLNRQLSKSLTAFFNWFRINPIVLYALGVITVFSTAAYFIFFKPYPKKDAEKLATELCGCFTTFHDEQKELYTTFLEEFSSNNFKKRSEARNSLSVKTQPVYSKLNGCTQNVYNKYESKKTEFDTKDRPKFETAYVEYQNNCANEQDFEVSELYTKTEKKIETIKDPEPDIAKIKEDLIGKKIPGWNFSYLSEFKDVRILNTTKGSEIIEYNLFFKLLDESRNSEHDCEVKAIYKKGYDGWYFENVKMIYITYTNEAPLNQWKKITPLKNCSYEIIHSGQRYWVQDGFWGKKYMAGPGGDQFYLKSAEIYIMSREDHPVNLTFKYKPNK